MTSNNKWRHHPGAGNGPWGEWADQPWSRGPGQRRGPRGFAGGPQGGPPPWAAALFGFAPDDQRRGPRARRGDVRSAILSVLAETQGGEPLNGYQVIQQIATKSEGAWRPSPGSVYPTIAQLEDEGLVSVTPDAGRKLVELTQAGRDYLAANATTLADPFAGAVENADGGADLREGVEQLRVAARAVGATGTGGQILAAQQILGDARRALYLVLADGPAASGPPAADSAAEGDEGRRAD